MFVFALMRLAGASWSRFFGYWTLGGDIGEVLLRIFTPAAHFSANTDFALLSSRCWNLEGFFFSGGKIVCKSSRG